VSENSATKILDINDIYISDSLTPPLINWVASRPATLHPWKIRSSDGWRICHIVLIETRVEDFTTELCNDTSAVPLPARTRILAGSLPYPDRLQRACEHAEADWIPCDGTVDAINSLAKSETIRIPLTQALSIMSFGSFADPHERDEIEVAAFTQQAATALCDAALMTDVWMYGIDLSAGGHAALIPAFAFNSLSYVSDPPSSLVSYSAIIASPPSKLVVAVSNSSSKKEKYTNGWLNVEVEVASFVEWLTEAINDERKKQLSKRVSRRLFEYPFWSIETTLFWIAIRDAAQLKANLLSPLRRHDLDRNVESQPEMRLLQELRKGKLKAQCDGRFLSTSHWPNSFATLESLTTESPALLLARGDVLCIFPELVAASYREVCARRQAKIDRIIQRMQATRKWISCAEIVNWEVRRSSKSFSDERDRASVFDRLKKTVYAGGFWSRGKSQLCRLSSDSSVVRLPCEPVDWTADARGFRLASFPVRHFLEDCWLPREMCRDWFARERLEWPAIFESDSQDAVQILNKPKPSEERRKPGRPGLTQPYKNEFERKLGSGSLCPTLQQEANKLAHWGLENLAACERVEAGTLENVIRDRLKSWDGVVPWKPK
jgi:hypothetical protein